MLTNGKRDQILVALLVKLAPDMVTQILGPGGILRDDPKEKKQKSKKPFDDAIGYDDGLKLLEGCGLMDLQEFARIVAVKKSSLEQVCNSLGFVYVMRPLPEAEYLLVWKTYCTKRGW